MANLIAKWKAKEDILVVFEPIKDGMYGMSEILQKTTTLFKQGDVLLEFDDGGFKEKEDCPMQWSFTREAIKRLFTKFWINHEVN